MGHEEIQLENERFKTVSLHTEHLGSLPSCIIWPPLLVAGMKVGLGAKSGEMGGGHLPVPARGWAASRGPGSRCSRAPTAAIAARKRSRSPGSQGQRDAGWSGPQRDKSTPITTTNLWGRCLRDPCVGPWLPSLHPLKNWCLLHPPAQPSYPVLRESVSLPTGCV